MHCTRLLQKCAGPGSKLDAPIAARSVLNILETGEMLQFEENSQRAWHVIPTQVVRGGDICSTRGVCAYITRLSTPSSVVEPPKLRGSLFIISFTSLVAQYPLSKHTARADALSLFDAFAATC